MPEHTPRPTGARLGRWTLVVLFMLVGVPTAPAAAQEGSGSDEAAERAERLARADSIRETLVQPPGDRDGLTAMDVIRAPFQVVGGVLSLALTAGVGTYEIFDELGVVDLVMDTRSDLSDAGLQVGVDYIGTRSWPAVVATWDALDPLFVEAGYSLRRYELYGAGLDFGDEDRGARLEGRYHVLREPHFWGVGPDTEDAFRSDFMLTRTGADAHAWSDFGGPVRLSLGGGWERNDVDRGDDPSRTDLQDVFDVDTLFGAAATTTFARVDAAVDADFTGDDPLQQSGVRLLGGYQVFRGLDDTDADFHRVTADVRAFVPVWRRQALAVRLLGTEHLQEEGEGVPLTSLAKLGDDDGLRGYTSRRFRDRALLAAQAEWRYEAWWHPGNPGLQVQGFAFADYGAVGPSLGDLESGDFELTPGLGLRLMRDGDGLAEAFIAWGGEKAPRLDASLGVTF